LRSINLRHGEIEKREEKLMDTMLDGIIPEDQIKKRNQKILADKQELIDEKRNLTSNNSMNLRKYDNFLELVSNPIKLYDLANSEEKRDLVELFTSNLVVDIKSLEISTVSPFSELLNRDLLRFGGQPATETRTLTYIRHPMTSPIKLGERSTSELKILFSRILEGLPSLPDVKHLLNYEIRTNNPSTKRST